MPDWSLDDVSKRGFIPSKWGYESALTVWSYVLHWDGELVEKAKTGPSLRSVCLVEEARLVCL